MSAINEHPDDELLLADLLEEFESRLGSGETSTLGSELSSVRDEADRERLERAKACVARLARVWPRTRVADDLPERIGRFRIERLVGRGGFGLVYLAWDDKLGRQVALKVQRPEAMISAALRERFAREARAAARLTHPQIARVYDVGDEGFRIWIASEFVAGDSLAGWLKRGDSQVSPRAAAAFIALLTDAVEFAHSQGVLHRDLKPSNVLLESLDTSADSPQDLARATPKLIDFGLAKLDEAARHETRSYAFIGTPAYMAPEQAVGNARAISPATDVYGLGTILYELLARRPAFSGETDLQTLRAVVEDEPVRLRKFDRRVPADLEAICLKCMEKEPQRRYGSPAALAADLRRFLQHAPTIARPLSPAVRAIKWVKRRPALAGLAAVSCGAAVALAVMAAVYVQRLAAANRSANEARVEAESSAESAQRHAQAAKQNLYSAQMRLAYQAIDQGDLREAAEMLAAYEQGTRQANLRGFEWYHLRRRLHGERFSLVGHEGEVYAVTFTPDGRQVVSGGEDGTIRFWDAQTGRPIQTIHAHPSCVNAVAYSASGEIFASASCDHKIKLWDAATHELLASLDDCANVVLCLAFHPQNGNLLAAGGREPMVRLWDVKTHEVVRVHEVKGETNGLAWQSDGDTLLIAGGPPPPLAPHCHTWRLSDDRFEEYPWRAICVAASSRGQNCWSEYAVYFQNKDSLVQPQALRGHTARVDAVAFSPDGDRLATAGGDHVIRIWDADKVVCLEALSGHTERIQCVAWSPRGGGLASASYDGTIRVWGEAPSDRVSWSDSLTLPDGSFAEFAIALSDDFRFLALRSQLDEARVLQLETGSLVGELPAPPHPYVLQFAPRSARLLGIADADGGVIEWDVDRWELTQEFPKPESGWAIDVWRFADYFITHRSGVTAILDASSGKVSQMLQGASSRDWRRTNCALSPDGASALVTLFGETNQDCVLDPAGNRRQVLIATGDESLAISNGARRIARKRGSFTIVLCDGVSGEVQAKLRHSEPVAAAAFSPDGKTLAVTSGDQRVVLWNVDSGQEVGRLVTKSGTLIKLQFSPDSRRLAVVGISDPQTSPYTLPGGTKKAGKTEFKLSVTIWSGSQDR